MGGIESKPFSPAAGRAYVEWVGKLNTGLRELMADGSIPQMAGFDEMYALSQRLDQAVLDAATAADRSGQATMIVRCDFTDIEMRKLGDMGIQMLRYIEVLTMRGKLDGAPSNEAMEAIIAMDLANM